MYENYGKMIVSSLLLERGAIMWCQENAWAIEVQQKVIYEWRKTGY